MILQGKFYTVSIIQETPIKHELAIGFLGIHLVGLTYSSFFVFISQRVSAFFKVYLAFLYGMGLIVFPFFVLQPSMGLGVMALSSPLTKSIILRTILIHFVYGCGLSVGTALSGRLLKRT